MSEKKEFVLSGKNSVQSETVGSVLCESSSEHVLPDYLPRVQKVLRMETSVLPPSRYMNTAEVQLSGNLLHTLVYVGEEGEIASAVLPARYECTVPLAEGTSPIVAVHMSVDSSAHRLTAPRKLQVRTKLRARTHLLEAREIVEQQLPSGGIVGLHRLAGAADTLCTTVLRSADVSVSDSVETGSATARPIWCGATAAVQDARVMDGGVNVRGDVCVKLLLTDNGKLKAVTKKIPFDTFLDGDVQKNGGVTAVAYVLSTEAVKEQGSEALADVVLSVEALVDHPCSIPIVEDAFSETADGKISYQTVPTMRLLADRSAVYSVGGSVTKSAAGAVGFVESVDTSGVATVEEVVAKDGRYTVTGRCMLNTLYAEESGAVSAADYDVPFKLTIDAKTAENAMHFVTVSLLSARTRADGESLVCDMELAVSMRAVACGEKRAVAVVDYTAPQPCAQSPYSLSLLYPSGESLWMLAKTHRVAPERLAACNGLEAAYEESPKTDVLLLEK